MDEAKATLVAMGFEAAAVENVLQETAGNLEQAANYLLLMGSNDPPRGPPDLLNHGGGGSTTNETDSTAAQQEPIIVQGTMSQYSVPDGRSACTCMALRAAATILQACAEEQADPGIITPDLLDNMVLQGSLIYREQLQSTINSNDSAAVEHTSAEDALQKCRAFAQLQLLPQGIQQGILSHDPSHPMGLPALLSTCQQNNAWTCVVITKPPETVLVVLPTSSSSSSSKPQYLWIDSHPRPGRYEQAACLRHSSLLSLVQETAATIFPVTDLGPDVPEFMATMYNSFDLYPLQWKEEQDSLFNDMS